MKKLFLILFSSLLISTACAEKTTETASKSAESTKVEEEKSVIITKAGSSFDDINESVRMAVADGGMIVSGTLHISDMLNRTGKDIGFDKNIFKKSEAVEFCSALISHKMAVAHPSNVSMCPFTVAIYELNDEPGVVYLSYRRVKLLGDGKKVEEEIIKLLQTIVDESVE
ncbi:MAG TPA: DUF302 domain-containing protein [Leucothrix mucor]|nr:DUF302 domain-containing protein [Leucothrix mucor]